MILTIEQWYLSDTPINRGFAARVEGAARRALGWLWDRSTDRRQAGARFII